MTQITGVICVLMFKGIGVIYFFMFMETGVISVYVCLWGLV